MSAVADRIAPEQIEAAKRVNLIDLAGQHSELSRASGREFAGPCPRCGGEDRLHVTAEWWFCRHCHQKRGDAIEFVRWLHPGLTFGEAVARLTGAAPAPTPAARRAPERRPPERAPWDAAAQERRLAEAQRLLWDDPAGEPGRAYLASRALEPHTWAAFGIGYALDAVGRGPAIALPWRAAGRLVGVRYRLLNPADGQKIVSEVGSSFSGRLFGGQALPGFVALPPEPGRRPAEELRWLLICEGEINAMSCWQAASESALDVLSLGSQSARLSPAAVQLAGRYGRVLVWADLGSQSARLMQTLPGAYGLQSPGGRDANDLLQSGLLAGFLALSRADAARDEPELERLWWALVDAAGTLRGLDTGSAEVLRSLAGRLGRGAGSGRGGNEHGAALRSGPLL